MTTGSDEADSVNQNSWWKHRADKPMVWFMVFLHVMALFVFVPSFFSWSGVIICLVLYYLTAGLGITLCFHRLLTHKSFKTYGIVRFFLTFIGCLAWQGSPIHWVGVHRLHHKDSDTDDDPHSPKHGFSWAHVFWLLTKKDYKISEMTKDLQKDSFVRILSRLFWLPQVVLAFTLFFVGMYFGGYLLGMSWVFWGIGLRTVLVYHATWFVNSASHTWGYRNFETKDDSRNLWWVAILAIGEGWHNNHHKYQRSAAHGMRWFELDPTYWMIILMSWFGLAWDIKRPPKVSTA